MPGPTPAPPPSRIGVCSWSLKPKSAEDLAQAVKRVGVSRVQLHLDPLRRGEAGWGEVSTLAALRAVGVRVVSGMMGMAGEDYSTLETIARTGGVRPDATWSANLSAARANADLAKRLGLPLVTFHAGFIPEGRAAERVKMIGRLREMADVFAAQGVGIAFETGQEDAATLLDALRELDRPAVGVNFDPANMILYGTGDPVTALEALAPRVLQIHIKDALPTGKTGTWGREVVAGTGLVDWDGFFGVIRSRGLACNLIIEREAGPNRFEDVIAARKLIERHLPHGGNT